MFLAITKLVLTMKKEQQNKLAQQPRDTIQVGGASGKKKSKCC